MERWNHTAWICLHLPSFGRRSQNFDDYHPLKRPKWTSLTPEEMKRSLAEHRKTLPTQLNELERERRWQQFCERQDAKRKSGG